MNLDLFLTRINQAKLDEVETIIYQGSDFIVVYNPITDEINVTVLYNGYTREQAPIFVLGNGTGTPYTVTDVTNTTTNDTYDIYTTDSGTGDVYFPYYGTANPTPLAEDIVGLSPNGTAQGRQLGATNRTLAEHMNLHPEPFERGRRGIAGAITLNAFAAVEDRLPHLRDTTRYDEPTGSDC